MDGKIRRRPNLNITTVKKTAETIEELKKLRDEIKRKYKQSKVETVLFDLEQLKKELNDKDLRQHLSSVAGIIEERPSLKKLLNFDNKLKSKNSKAEGTEKSPFTL
jgi:hypothetical protein